MSITDLYGVGTSNADNSFIGFSFNGHHSSSLGIVRTSDGSRYNDSIIPQFQDKTAQVTGNDGTLYWESFYTNKPFSISIAFDSLSESGYRKLRQVFNGKAIGELIFDEMPYKAYYVKVQTPPQLNTLCFDENGKRVYKGEGTLQFVAFYPYAYSVHKYLNEFADDSYPNKAEWSASTSMLFTQGTYDATNSSSILLYNPGDLDTDWTAYYYFSGSSCQLSNIYMEVNGNTEAMMVFSKPIYKASASDSYMRVNSATNLIEGCDSSYNLTGTLYNKYLSAGDFFKIPNVNATDPTASIRFLSTGAKCSKVDYKYLYY